MHVHASFLRGQCTVPASKSHSMRALLLGSLCEGRSYIQNVLCSPDICCMQRACESLGAIFSLSEGENGKNYQIDGVAGQPLPPNKQIDSGNSGQVLRFVTAIVSLISHNKHTLLSGDLSIQSRRPIKPLLKAICQLGGSARSQLGNGYAPIIIQGPIRGGHVSIDGRDSQLVSALLFAASFLPDSLYLTVHNPGEIPWIRLTLYWLNRLGVQWQKREWHYYVIRGKKKYGAQKYSVPGDWSSAAFLIVAALITGSELSLNHLRWEDVQGDKKIVLLLRQMGAEITWISSKEQLHIHPLKQTLSPFTLNANEIIDLLPILAVLACFTSGPCLLYGASIAREKESDRIHAICKELTKMGGKIEERRDGLTIFPTTLHGARVNSHGDHRIALALGIAALTAKGTTLVEDSSCIAKSFPYFVPTMQSLGAQIEEYNDEK